VPPPGHSHRSPKKWRPTSSSRAAGISATTSFRVIFSAAADCRAPQRARDKTVYLHLLQAANEPIFNLHKISSVFKRDVSLSYRLLRYLNSAAFAFSQGDSFDPACARPAGRSRHAQMDIACSVAALGDAVADSLLRLPLLRAMVLRTDRDQGGHDPRGQ